MIEMEKQLDRRGEYKCTKLDTFASIENSLGRIEAKVDDLSSEMRVVIKLEQQSLTQSKDIERLNLSIEDLRKQNSDLTKQLMDLQSRFELQKTSISTIERIGWAAATCIAVIVGKKFGIDL